MLRPINRVPRNAPCRASFLADSLALLNAVNAPGREARSGPQEAIRKQWQYLPRTAWGINDSRLRKPYGTPLKRGVWGVGGAGLRKVNRPLWRTRNNGVIF